MFAQPVLVALASPLAKFWGRSFITGRGCYKTVVMGGSEVLPPKKGVRKSFSHAEGGAQQVFGQF